MEQTIAIGDRVRVLEIRDGHEMPPDVVGRTGIVRWITPGYAGERGLVEVVLDDGYVLEFLRVELELTEPGSRSQLGHLA